jgi:hypothetical protein
MDEMVLNRDRLNKTSSQDDPEPLPALHQRATLHFDHADSKSAAVAAIAYAPLPSAGPGEQQELRPKVPMWPTIFT